VKAVALLAFLQTAPAPAVDEILWVPTLAQAELASKETGRAIFVVGVVGDWNAWANGMIHEENRAFVQDLFGMVKPLAERYVAVRLDYHPQRGAWKGELWKRLGGNWGMACQVVIGPDRSILTSGRCHKNGNGISPKELVELAPADPKRKDRLRLSWFLMDPAFAREDHLDEGAAQRAGQPDHFVEQARRARRPLCRVDGPALGLLEGHAEFLARHVRQFAWQKGDPQAPARLVVLDPQEFPADAKPDGLAGRGSPGKIPRVLAALDLSGGVDLKVVSPALDEAWRAYMAHRPSNVDFMTFAEDVKPKCREFDESIRRAAASGRLLAPGGRPLQPSRR
jgi:hypothetical protein